MENNASEKQNIILNILKIQKITIKSKITNNHGSPKGTNGNP